jgi:hypothetical protein
VDRLVQLVNRVAMDATVSTVCQVSLVIAVRPPHRRRNWDQPSRINARAKLHQATLVRQDQKDPTDRPETLVRQAPMARTETKDHADHPDHPARPVRQARKDQPVIPAESPAPDPAPLAHLARLVNPVPQALQADLVMPAKMVLQAPQVLPVMLVPLAVPVKPAAPAVPETPAVPVPQVPATTAHRLVWLQVIKQRNRGQYDWAPSTVQVINLFLTFPLVFGKKPFFF